MTDDQWAQQYEVNYTAGHRPGQIFKEFSRNLHLYNEEKWGNVEAGGYLYDATIYESWDFGLATAVVWIAVIEDEWGDKEAYVLDYRAWQDRLPEEIVADVVDAGWYAEMSAFKHGEELARLGRQGRKPHYRVGDSAMGKRSDRDLRTTRQAYRDLGIELRSKSNQAVNKSINRIRLALKHEKLFFSPKCDRRLDHYHYGHVPPLISCMENYRKDIPSADLRDYIEKGSALHPKPVKDQFSHLADALRYAGDWIWGDDPVIRQSIQKRDGTWT